MPKNAKFSSTYYNLIKKYSGIRLLRKSLKRVGTVMCSTYQTIFSKFFEQI